MKPLPSTLRLSTLRLVWLFPAPVRAAHTATTGFEEATIVCSAPSSR